MKIQKTVKLNCICLFLLLASVFHGAAATLTWTNACGIGGVGGNMTWTNAANWTNSAGANAVPTLVDEVSFINERATNGIGLVNSIVAADIQVTNVAFNMVTPNYHTILINPGVTLTLWEPAVTAATNKFSILVASQPTNVVASSYATIQGTGGTVVVGDTNTPGTADYMRIYLNGTNLSATVLGNYMATMDLSGLDNFSCALGSMRIGNSGPASAHGTLILAKTNTLIVADPSSSASAGRGFVMGEGTIAIAGNYDSEGRVKLGQVNVIRAYNTKVGSSRAVGSMEFQTNLVNPTVYWRGSNGVDAANLILIGDNFAMPAVAPATYSGTCTGRLDLVGGTVDVLVGQVIVGRNGSAQLGSSSRGGSGHGTLAWSAGTIVVIDSTDIGRQARDNFGTSIGVVNVLTNAVLQTGSIRIGRDLGAGAGIGIGTLNIAYGGQVMVTNNILEESALTTGSSTINVTNGTLTMLNPFLTNGLVLVDNLNLENATNTLTVGPTITSANPVCNVTNLTVNNSATFNLSGSGLTLASYPLIKYMGSIGGGGFALALGTQPTDTSGYLFDNTANKTIDYVVTNVPATKWKGNVNGDWDINTTTNWIYTTNNAAAAYQEGDTVVFDDTAITNTVNLTTTLNPGAVAVITTNTYTFIGTGGLSGPGGLYKGGSGTLEVANSGANDYSGTTLVVGGTLRVNSALSGGGAVTVQGGGTLGGTGSVAGPVTIGSGGTLAAGNSIGTLTFYNTVVMSAGSSSVFEVNSDTLASDLVAGLAGVTYGGTLVISTNGGNTALTNGAEIQLFSPAGSGTFAAIVPTYPGPGMNWDQSTLASDGKLRIFAVPAGNLVIWTNNAGGSLLWSNPTDWIRTNNAYANSLTPNSVPAADDAVLFGNLGVTNGPGLVNNIVGASTTVSNLYFEAISTNGYHTTLVNPGVTLTVDNPKLVGNETILSAVVYGSLNDQLYATIRGTNASLVIGVPSPANTNFGFEVVATCTNLDASISSHRATLDLSGLDNFTYYGGYMLIGEGGSGAGNQPAGTLLLARTNLVIASRTTNQSPAGIIRISHNTAGNATGQSENLVELGQVNTIRAEYLRIGASKALNGGAIRFRTGLTSPTLRLRGPDDVSRMPLLTLGDNNDVATGVPSTGVLDLSGGVVDALVETVHVGRTYNGDANTTRSGTGIGLLKLTWGTLDVTTLNIGCQSLDNRGNGTGVVQVASSVLLVAGNINMGRDAGSGNAQTGFGVLNLVSGGKATVTGNVLENSAGGGDGTSTINLTNGTLVVGGVIAVDTVNMISGVVSNTGLMTVGTLTGSGTISGPLTVTNTLAPGNSPGTLTNFSDLILSNTATSTMEINLDTLACDKVVGLNSVTFDGTLTVVNIGGTTAATNGATLQLFSAANYLGAFTTTNLPALTGGKAWDTSGLTNGTLRVVATVNTTPTNLTYSLAGNALNISWPSDHTGWRLQGQTNPVNVGISNNWFTVPGSTATNQVIMTVNPANGAVFYRLIYP